MNKVVFILLSIFAFSSTKNAQAQFFPTSNLTIFSEDGHKFFLILNGERQNDVAQTNVRIEELPQPYYNCKIIFENKSLNEISRNNLMLVDGDGIHQDVTYRIKADNKGKQVLRFQSFVPAQQNMLRPSNVPVYRFGNPNQIIFGPGLVQTTTSTTITERNNSNGVGVNMNVGGVGVNVSINDPELNSQSTTTTTTRTTTSTTTTRSNQMDYQDEPMAGTVGCFEAYPMAPRDFEAARATIKNENFDETRLDIAKQIASSNCLKTDQILAICNLITFEASKLEFAKFAYDHCVDPRNYFKVVNAFTFSSSKQELNTYIQGR